MVVVKTEHYSIEISNGSGSLIILPPRNTKSLSTIPLRHTTPNNQILSKESVGYYVKYRRERREMENQNNKSTFVSTPPNIKPKTPDENLVKYISSKKPWLLKDPDTILDDYIYIITK